MNALIIPDHDPLSAREHEVIDLADQGLTDAEIAAVLTISIWTVRDHLRTINRKLHVGNRREAAYIARQLRVNPSS